MLEIQLFKKFLNYQFYLENKQHIALDIFPADLRSLYVELDKFYNKYARDINLTEFAHFYKLENPTLTEAKSRNIDRVFDAINSTENLHDDLARDAVRTLGKREFARQIAERAVRIASGQEDDFNSIVTLLENCNGGNLLDTRFTPVTTDIDQLIESLQLQGRYTLNIPQLQQVIPGIGPGNLVIVFARPEIGKTAFWVSLCSGPNGFADQGASIHALINEEPAVRTMMRAINCYTGLTLETIQGNTQQTRTLFAPIASRLHLVDSVDMSMNHVDDYVRHNHPDILVIDQLDKVHIGGSYARSDEKLKAIYTATREIAKRHNCLVIAVSQASYDAEGKRDLTYAMLDNSKTGKAGEADLIIGVGHNPAIDAETIRHIYISKNKINGWHGARQVLFNGSISRYYTNES